MFNTASVSLAVTPTVVSTLLSHYLNRKPLRQRPTAHLSYDEGLHLIRAFLDFASHHTVEELQAFTAQWVPHPQWVRLEEITIADEFIDRAATLLQDELGQDGIRRVGGRQWWQWRKPSSKLKAEWIEMRSDYHERKKAGGSCKRVMFYIHGGAYYFGSVDEHRYQLQRHARKLKARVLAPRYRLAPQFPFPCGLQDCVATYLHLLTIQDPNTIIIAGDSAGGGMALSLLVVLRNRGIPLPAGGILLSPWVDLSHSFPSVAADNPLDYIPTCGFQHKPSRAWPPPNEDDLIAMREEAARKLAKAKASRNGARPSTSTLHEVKDAPDLLSIAIDGNTMTLKDQIQMYTTNDLLSHPLVSPVKQPSLGGLPPLLIMVGGGESLRDEQIYLAHKCANPAKYAPPEEHLDEKAKAQLKEFKPTDVQLQVWDDLCHVAPTLSFTRPAKYMYRSIAQFGAWALARAQETGIDILDDDAISIISNSASDTEESAVEQDAKTPTDLPVQDAQIGKAGDPLPQFKAHMIRQRVDRHGVIYPLAPAADLPACCMTASEVGVIKEGPVRRWLERKGLWETRYASIRTNVHKKIIKDMVAGYLEFGDGERPPPSALAGRRKVASELAEHKKRKSMGLALWSLWGSKHDEKTVEREQKAEEEPETKTATAAEGSGARPFQDIEKQDPPPVRPDGTSRSRSRIRTVVDEHQTEDHGIDEDTPIAQLMELRREREAKTSGLLTPDYSPETGVMGKRPMIDGIAVPFSIKKDAETASMVTLTSAVDASRPISPAPPVSATPAEGVKTPAELDRQQVIEERKPTHETVESPDAASRLPLDTFVTAAEALPQVEGKGKGKDSG